jgi:heme/copper-type cytochrome/quinol oxidase subunit 3
VQHVAVAPPVHGGHEEHQNQTGLNHRKVLMWAFLGSDCMFFGALIGTYLIYRGRALTGPSPEQVFDIPYTSVSAFALLMSSLAMVMALAAIQRGDTRRLKIWLLATAGLGLVFLGGQVYEFTSFATAQGGDHPRPALTLSTSTFGTTFFVLTGFHGTHVALGVVWLLTLAMLAQRGVITQERALDVEIAGLYWHFVDIVWIVIFTVVYLIPTPMLAGGAH